MRTFVLLLTAAPVMLAAQAPSDSNRARLDSVRGRSHPLEAVTISAIRARDEAPIASHTVDAADIDRRSFGQEVPLLLQGTPSLTSYAETGNYWGYSYVRIRGIDQSRINLSIDGIPLNDPEDQVLYFADFPDLAASIHSVQIQRGTGTSAPGTASYGGSINFQTVPVLSVPRAGRAELQGGSFGSRRASVEYASGTMAGRFAVYGRASALQSSGFRRHSGTEGRSGVLSAAYVRDRDVLKLTALAGFFADTLAYIGATRGELAVDRRLNPLRPDETDRFGEQVVALSYTRSLTPSSSASLTTYRTSASGNYDVCIFNCDQPVGDLWNFHLDFVWYGATAAWTMERDRLRASAGVNANTYARDHHAYARPDLATPLYFNTGRKDDGSVFGKVAYDVGRWTLFGDLQGRHARFAYEPDANAAIPAAEISWSFLNPKAGATLRLTRSAEAFASYGINVREPARSDMLAGFDNLDTSNVAFVGPLSRVRPERALDFEAGLRLRGERATLDANVFAMEFRNEILPVGRLSYIGTPLRSNVGASWRRGIELDATASPTPDFSVGATATFMRARIAEYTDDEAGVTYHDVEPLLTPRFTSGQRVSLRVSPRLRLGLTGQYVSRSFLTNTGSSALTLPSNWLGGLESEWTRGPHGITVRVNNVTNSRRFGGGHVSFGEARYYVLPPLNVFVQARLGM
jgi:iron complex outermembrane recepter protein